MRHGRLRVITLAGLTPYAKAHALQLKMVEERKRGTIGDTLLLLEHPPVITLGRNADPAGVTAAPSVLEELGIETHRIERGGQVTYHGPGQVVGYPILDLRNLKIGVGRFVRMLEDTMIQAAAALGIEAGRKEGIIGIFTEQGKIGAIGVRITRGVSFHGFAFNIDPDLSHFQLIIPCGLMDESVTSAAGILGKAPPMTAVKEMFAGTFARVFGLKIQG